MKKASGYQVFVMSLMVGTGGVGSAAMDIANKRRSIYECQAERAETYFPLLNAVLPEMQEVLAETSYPNWNGYGAEPVSMMSFERAKHFISLLPGSTPVPGVSASPSGQILLEWYRAPKQLLSVSVSPIGQLHFSALVGNEESYGVRDFVDRPPEDISRLIGEVMTPNGQGDGNAGASR